MRILEVLNVIELDLETLSFVAGGEGDGDGGGYVPPDHLPVGDGHVLLGAGVGHGGDDGNDGDHDHHESHGHHHAQDDELATKIGGSATATGSATSTEQGVASASASSVTNRFDPADLPPDDITRAGIPALSYGASADYTGGTWFTDTRLAFDAFFATLDCRPGAEADELAQHIYVAGMWRVDHPESPSGPSDADLLLLAGERALDATSLVQWRAYVASLQGEEATVALRQIMGSPTIIGA